MTSPGFGLTVEVMWLKMKTKMSHEEIAEHLDISRHAVSQAVNHRIPDFDEEQFRDFLAIMKDRSRDIQEMDSKSQPKKSYEETQ